MTGDSAPPGIELGDEDFELLRTVLQNETGIVLKDGKRPLLRSRLLPLLLRRGKRRFSELLDGVASPEHRNQVLSCLIEAITTNLTEFFREPGQLDMLVRSVVPWALDLLGSGAAARVSIWSAGCSTGQEPWSIAMALREAVPPDRLPGFRVLGTDIDRSALAQAKAGIYLREELKGLDAGRIQTHLVLRPDGRYEVVPALRDLVRFAERNLVQASTWGHGRFHVIFCRNVLIYFEKSRKDALVRTFHDRLHPGGFLFLGHSEGIQSEAHDFEYLGPSSYRRIR